MIAVDRGTVRLSMLDGETASADAAIVAAIRANAIDWCHPRSPRIASTGAIAMPAAKKKARVPSMLLTVL